MADDPSDTGWEKMDTDSFNVATSYPPFFRTWAAVIPLMGLDLLTLTGNGIVIVMFWRMTKLRNFKNSFIASLAVADFLVGCTEPFSLIETAHGRWPGTRAQCQAFLAFRYSLCYVSLLSILFISVDRWWSIQHPFAYRVRRSKRLAVWVIASGWTFSFLIHTCPLVSWEILHNEIHNFPGENQDKNANLSTKRNVDDSMFCLPPYKGDFLFTAVTFSMEYVLLLLALIVLNASVYWKIRRRKATKIRRSLSTSEYHFHMSRKSSSDSENAVADEDHLGFYSYIRRPNSRAVGYKEFTPKTRRHTLAQNILNAGVSASHIARLASSRRVSFDVTVLAQPLASRKTTQHSVVSRAGFAPHSCQTRRQSTSEELVRDLLIRQDKKAACSLGILVLVLAVCWTPLSICSIIYSYDSSLIPVWALMVAQWVAAANSVANPFLYAIGNGEFRKVIKTWVGCVDARPFIYHKAFLYHSIQLPTEQDMTKETLTSNCSKE